ncbi:MAG: hypothetical protein FKY71_08125 [Spiribacter salinus]|uniref:Uncharacterized protein n=1 Tax=Spiribacter salinus TaxID=1335746 RepID=A0A540VRZ0_9GAMM|nr:MAG: hypothetical protein FKY71_08125 [Spiribacter salinus]
MTRTLTALALVLSVAGPASALEINDRASYCEFVAKNAGLAMTARQDGMLLTDAFAMVKERADALPGKVEEMLTGVYASAFNEPVFRNDNEMSAYQIIDFQNDWHVICLFEEMAHEFTYPEVLSSQK